MVRTPTIYEDHPMAYTIVNKHNGYWSVHFHGCFCMTCSSLEACKEYVALQGGVLPGVDQAG